MSREKENGEERKLMQRCRNLSERVAQHNRRMKAEEQALKSETSMVFVELKERIGKAKEACKTSHSEGSEEEMAELMAVKKVLQGQGPGGDLRVLNVSTRDTPILVRNMLGNHAAGVLNRHDQRLQLKEEYFKFRRRTGIVFTIVPTILSFGLRRAQQLQLVGEPFSLSPPLYVSLQVYAVWLVYFYCSMALRENILVMNGSDIRSWWIQHHYVMLAFMLVLITLPIESEAFKIFARKFTDFNVLQGFIMMFQNRYQARRLYRQIALGRNSAMDVVSSDASPGKGHLLLLYPALFGKRLLSFASSIISTISAPASSFVELC